MRLRRVSGWMPSRPVEPHLGLQGELPDLVQEERLPFRPLEASAVGVRGAREAALVEAEQLAVDAKGATVRLYKGEDQLGEADAFGDFTFERLEVGSGTYPVEASLGSLRSARIEVELRESRTIGTPLVPQDS